MQPLGLVLTPEPEIADRIITMAQHLLPVVGPVRSMLSEKALPHISFAHVRSSVEPEAVWAEAGSLFDVEQITEVVTIGLRFHGDRRSYLAEHEGGGGITVFMQVRFDDTLRRMREIVESMTWMKAGEVTLYPLGATLDPHFTLGVTMPGSGFTIPGPIEVPEELLQITIPMRLALGPIGEYGVLQKVLAGGW